jgi:ABC-2 type transport system permease protein
MKYKHIFSKQNSALLTELVRTDFKLRYQGSALGYAWSLLRPLLLFLILYIVFVRFLKIGGDIPHFPVYLLLGIVMWNFFNEMTVLSLGSIVGRGDLIRKIRIPRWIIVLSSSISALINLFLNLLVVGVFMIVNDVNVLASALWFPLILAEVYVLALGCSLFLSAAFVKFRDIGYIWEVIMQAGFYLTPVLYPMSQIPNETFRKIILLNPMAQAIQDARFSLISHDSGVMTISRVFDGGPYVLIPFIVVGVVVALGVVYFRKESKYFAENI